ncbi:MAG: adenylosuccinate lyase, partial [Candidatus Lokiarchaeota archaeon]
HEILRQSAIQARKENRFMKDILMENKEIKEKFNEQEFNDLFDPHKYIGKSLKQVEELLNYLKRKYKLD